MFLLNYLNLKKKRLSFGVGNLAVSLAVMLLSVYTAGCSNGVTNPTSSNVTFAISQQNGTSGVQFLAKPNVDVKVTRIISNLSSASFSDTVINQNPNYTFSKDSSYIINEYTGVASGQQWKFYFTGTQISGGAAYDVTSSYTVP